MSNIKEMTKSAIFCTLLCIGAFIKIPFPNMPMTMQMFFVLLGAVVLRPTTVLLSVALYIALGFAGLPVFSQGGGLSYVMVPSFGYILGFLPAVYFGAKTKSLIKALAVCILWVYAVGLSYFWALTGALSGDFKIFIHIIKVYIPAMLPKDILSAALAAIVAKRLYKTNIFSRQYQKTVDKT